MENGRLARLQEVKPVVGFARQEFFRAVKPVIATLLLSGFSLTALAKSCDSNGNLRFVGTTADSTRSVWLSATSAGAFRLDSAQGNQTVDSWSKSRRGLHLSL